MHHDFYPERTAFAEALAAEKRRNWSIIRPFVPQGRKTVIFS